MKNNEVILDTKPLIMAGGEIIEQISGKYGKKECRAITEFLKEKKISTTPQVFAEFYSLIKSHFGKDFSKYSLETMKKIFEEINEVYVEKEEIINDNKFPDFGFTDISLVKSGKSLLTSDFSLYNYAKSQGVSVKHIDEIFTLGVVK
ncbi:MAG TPA: hypothetical protein ENL09_01780 [Bacteroidetes bacterium]|nr:hypothetical protein [Bacteroidota bacterium]